jgi:hypothetical protein
MTIDEAREMALAIAKLPEVLMRKDKAPQDRDQHRLQAPVKWPNVPDLMLLCLLIPFQRTHPFRA